MTQTQQRFTVIKDHLTHQYWLFTEEVLPSGHTKLMRFSSINRDNYRDAKTSIPKVPRKPTPTERRQ